MSEEQKIYANDNGYHYQNEKHRIDIPWHFNHLFKYVSSRLSMKLLGFPLDPLGRWLRSRAGALA